MIKKIKYPKNPEPLRVEFEVTNHCNADCKFCPRFNIKSKGYMDLEKFKDFIINFKKIKPFLEVSQKFKKKNLPIIVFGGYGEPLMHPKIFEFIAFTKKEGFKTELITNGLLLNQINCERLFNAGLDKLAISLHTLNPEINKKISGLPDVIPVLSTALSYLDNKPIEIEIWRVAKFNGQNYDPDEKEGAYSNFLKEYKKEIKVLGPTPAWNRGGQYNSNFYPLVNDSKEIRCQTAYFTLNVSFNGDFVSCCCDFSSKENILAEKWNFDFEDIQKKTKFLMQHPSPMCKLCRKPIDNQYSKLNAYPEKA